MAGHLRKKNPKMPRKKTSYKPKKKPTYKKTYKKKTRYYKRKSRPLRGPMSAVVRSDPFPVRYNTKLKYSETFTLTVGTAGVFGTVQKLNLNGLYDPNYTGSGHQPYGYDQLTPLYARYIVHGCKVTAQFYDPDQDSLTVGCMVQQSGGTGSLAGIFPDLIKEQPYSWVKDISNTGSQKATMVQYFPLAKLEGLSKVQWQASLTDFAAANNANPSRTPTIQMAVANSRATGAGSITVRVMMTYYCQFYDRILQAYS